MTSLLYIQPDGTVLAQTHNAEYDSARAILMTFAEMTTRSDPIHVYKIRPVSLWQAASLGYSAREILGFLRQYTAHPLPMTLQQMIVAETSKWGKLVLHKGPHERIVLRGDKLLLRELKHERTYLPEMIMTSANDGLVFHMRDRALVKRALTKLGYPVLDRAGYQVAPSVTFTLRSSTLLRDYQQTAIDRFFDHSQSQSGVIVLPCGAGKTVVGIGILARLQMHALVLAPTDASARQWHREFLDRTTLDDTMVSVYKPDRPLTPVTITTYPMVTARNRQGEYRHFAALTEHPWGIVIYDEVHMLPAPLFRLAADLQGARRLGLSATLVREDGAAADVFSLIGPKCYEVPWKQLEQQGYLSRVRCVEVKVPMSSNLSNEYSDAPVRLKHALAARNPDKLPIIEYLIRKHQGEGILVIGHYLDQLRTVASIIGCPLVTGQTLPEERERLLGGFREGVITCLVLSRIANMAVDLPRASVAIQVSGLFGSRQEEAQRLGRLLRPTTSEGVFYSLVTAQSTEERLARHRQLYLVEQGYKYEVVPIEDLMKVPMI